MNNAYYGNNIPNGPIYNGEIPKDVKNTNVYNYELPIEQSYIENILRINKGKDVKVYMSYPVSGDKEYSGIIENTGKDYLLISEPSTGKWYMLPIMYLNYITFNEKINY